LGLIGKRGGKKNDSRGEGKEVHPARTKREVGSGPAYTCLLRSFSRSNLSTMPNETEGGRFFCVGSPGVFFPSMGQDLSWGMGGKQKD